MAKEGHLDTVALTAMDRQHALADPSMTSSQHRDHYPRVHR